jgi:hypothetical protein
MGVYGLYFSILKVSNSEKMFNMSAQPYFIKINRCTQLWKTVMRAVVLSPPVGRRSLRNNFANLCLPARPRRLWRGNPGSFSHLGWRGMACLPMSGTPPADFPAKRKRRYFSAWFR